MTPELTRLCQRRYGERWWLGLAADISRLSGTPLRPVQRTTLRWARVETEPTPPAVALIRVLTGDME